MATTTKYYAIVPERILEKPFGPEGLAYAARINTLGVYGWAAGVPIHTTRHLSAKVKAANSYARKLWADRCYLLGQDPDTFVAVALDLAHERRSSVVRLNETIPPERKSLLENFCAYGEDRSFRDGVNQNWRSYLSASGGIKMDGLRAVGIDVMVDETRDNQRYLVDLSRIMNIVGCSFFTPTADDIAPLPVAKSSINLPWKKEDLDRRFHVEALDYALTTGRLSPLARVQRAIGEGGIVWCKSGPIDIVFPLAEEYTLSHVIRAFGGQVPDRSFFFDEGRAYLVGEDAGENYLDAQTALRRVTTQGIDGLLPQTVYPATMDYETFFRLEQLKLLGWVTAHNDMLDRNFAVHVKYGPTCFDAGGSGRAEMDGTKEDFLTRARRRGGVPWGVQIIPPPALSLDASARTLSLCKKRMPNVYKTLKNIATDFSKRGLLALMPPESAASFTLESMQRLGKDIDTWCDELLQEVNGQIAIRDHSINSRLLSGPKVKRAP